MPSSPSYLSNLTPLRGIAALMVVVLHFSIFVTPLIDPQTSLAMRRWYLMVDFFFILSGFIMMHVYGEWFTENVSRHTFLKYLGARFARIYPLHFVTLLWVVGLFTLFRVKGIYLDANASSVGNFSKIPEHLLLLHGLDMPRTGTWNTPSWSIAAEWLMYLVFPFLVQPFYRFRSIGRVVAMIGALLLYASVPASKIVPGYEAFRLENGIDNIVTPWNLVRCLAGFLIGMVTYRAFQAKIGIEWLKNGWLLPLIGVALLIAYHFQVSDLITVWAFPIIILIACYNQGKLSGILQTSVFQRLGYWSYSIYLVHIPIIFTFLAIQLLQNPPVPNKPSPPLTYVGGWGPWIMCFIFVLLVIGVAALTYRFVELPARKWLNAKFESGNTQIVSSSI